MKEELFLERLVNRYSESNKQKIQDLKDWIKRENITETKLDTIDLLLQENYPKKSYPFVKDINDIYKKGYSLVSGNKYIVDSYTEKTDDIYYHTAFVNYVCKKQNMQIKDIIKYYKIYETKKINQHEMNTYENYFLYIFSDLITNYRARKRKKVTGENNRNKTEYELAQLLQGANIDIEREPDPTQEDLLYIREIFMSIGSKKTLTNDTKSVNHM